ncbi:ribonuclease P protein component [Coralloluteibacterium thermophilus]|uniref:Ribonuclease P protein component n=1 Tax=Coralloluteibacterium thermophilum TaxID=2707049 RepID=A0ABV9NPR6_9GAMM
MLAAAPRAASVSPFPAERVPAERAVPVPQPIDVATRRPEAMNSPHPSVAFPRDARVRASAEYARVFADCRRIHGDAFRLHVHVHEAGAPARLGIAVSRRVSKRAVERNRIKRCVRESFRHVRARLPAADYVLVARPEAAGRDGATLRADLERLWTRAAALKAPGAGGTMPRAAAAVPAAPTSDS